MNNPIDITSWDEMERAEKARRATENPWTAQDDARVDLKSKAERERNEAFAKANPAEPEDEDADCD